MHLAPKPWMGLAAQVVAGILAVVVSFLLSTASAKQNAQQQLDLRVSKMEAADGARDQRLERIEGRVDDIYHLMLQQKQQGK